MENLNASQQARLDDLMAEFKKENESIELPLPDGKFYLYHPDDKYVMIKGNTETLKSLVETIKPTKKFVIETAGKDHPTESMYSLKLKNPCTVNNYLQFEVEIQWTHNNTRVFVKLTADAVEKWTERGTRNLSSTEYHYFVGTSHNNLVNMKVSKLDWIGMGGAQKMYWNGGDVTILSKSIIDDVMKHLLK